MPRMLLALALFATLTGDALAAPALVPAGADIRLASSPSLVATSVAVLAGGGFAVAWFDGTGHLRLLDAAGTPRGPELPLPGRFDGRIAESPDGGFVAAWSETVGEHAAVFVRRFDRNGRPLGRQMRLSRESGVEDAVRPLVAVGADGRIAVAWTQWMPGPDPPGYSYTDAVARVIAPSGRFLHPEVLLLAGDPPKVGDDPFDASPTSIAVAPDGGVAAVVQVDQLCVLEMLARVSQLGKVWQLVGLGTSSCQPSYGAAASGLAVGRDGSLVAAWSEWCTVGQRFTPTGAPRGPWVNLGCDEGAPEPQGEVAITLQEGGSYSVVFTSEPDAGLASGDVWLRSFRADGLPRTGYIRLGRGAPGVQIRPDVAAPREGAGLAVWIEVRGEERTLVARRLVPR
jgi:hypothetical protein